MIYNFSLHTTTNLCQTPISGIDSSPPCWKVFKKHNTEISVHFKYPCTPMRFFRGGMASLILIYVAIAIRFIYHIAYTLCGNFLNHKLQRTIPICDLRSRLQQGVDNVIDSKYGFRRQESVKTSFGFLRFLSKTWIL